jgi:hypothetical protein
MKKTDFPNDDELRAEYVRSDFGEMVRGKYSGQMKSVHLVALDPDLAAAFPTDRAVNDALRSLLATGKLPSTPD